MDDSSPQDELCPSHDSNYADQQYDMPPGMVQLEREIDDENFDVNSLDLHSRTDGSLASALGFQSFLNGRTNSNAPTRKRSSKLSRKSPSPPKETIRTRAPPKKPYEPTPFLSIDNIPVDKKITENQVKKEGPSMRNGARSASIRGLPVPLNTPAPTGYFGGLTAASSTNVSIVSGEWNNMVPRTHKSLSKQVKQVTQNGHVRSPFKQDRSTPTNKKKNNVLPDQKMKEDTAAATYQVAKSIALQQPESEKKIPGRLLKARLKPLNTVTVTGPTMQHCRGIVSVPRSRPRSLYSDRSCPVSFMGFSLLRSQALLSIEHKLKEIDEDDSGFIDVRGYSPSPNKTLERRRYILSNLNKDFMYERPQTAESIHHTSVASDVTEREIVDSGPEDSDYLQVHSDEILESSEAEAAERFVIPPNSLASVSEPRYSQLQHFADTPNTKSGETPNLGIQSSDTIQPGSQDDFNAGGDGQNLRSNESSSQEAVLAEGEGRSEHGQGQSETGEMFGHDTNKSSGEIQGQGYESRQSDPDKQEVDLSASYFRDRGASSNAADTTAMDVINRPRPRSVQEPGLRKSVRFAEMHPSENATHEVSRSRSAMPRLPPSRDPESGKDGAIRKQEKSKSRSSCKPNGEESKASWEEDPDNDKGSGGGGGSSKDGGSIIGSSNGASNHLGRRMTPDGGSPPSDGPKDDEDVNTLRTSISDVCYGLEDPDIANQRPNSHVTRPRSRLGFWEDSAKPEENFSLSVSGQGKDFTSRDGSEIIKDETNGDLPTKKFTRTGGYTHPKPMRPQSAKGPREYIMEEKIKIIQRARPASARPFNAEDSVIMNPSPLNDRPLSARTASEKEQYLDDAASKCPSKRSQVVSHKITTRTRPQSAKTAPISRPPSTKRSRPSSAKVTKTSSVKGPRIGSSEKSRRTQEGKKRCSYCGKMSAKDIDFSSGNYFSVCESCQKQSHSVQNKMSNTQPKERVRVQFDVMQTEVDLTGEESKVQSGLAEITGSMEERTTFFEDNNTSGNQIIYRRQDIAHSSYGDQNPDQPDTSVICEPENTHTEDEKSKIEQPTQNGTQILSSLIDIEKSLDEVQKEIRECLRKSTERSNADSLAQVQKSDSKFVSLSGEISTHLIGGPDYNWQAIETTMKVFQFVEKETKYEAENSDDMGDGHSQLTNGNADENSKLTNGNADEGHGSISTYDLKLMSPLNEWENSTATEKPYLAQLAEQLPKENKSRMCSSEEKSRTSSLPLEVTAVAKTLQQPNVELNNGPQPVAPFAPLCFKINCRPPAGYMYYYAYGMDMNPNRMGTYIQREVLQMYWGLLFGFQLAFNKRGVDMEAGALPNIELKSGCSVEGVLYLITQAELHRIDKHVGYPEHFERVVLPVWLLNCDEPDELGLAQYCLPAVLYIARDRWIHKGPPLDCSYSADQCLKGNTKLSENYVKQLESYRDSSA